MSEKQNGNRCDGESRPTQTRPKARPVTTAAISKKKLEKLRFLRASRGKGAGLGDISNDLFA